MKRWRWILGLPLLAAAAYFAWGLMLAAKYEARLDALRAAGEPVTYEDLAGPEVPSDQNGAALLREASEIFKKVNEKWTFRLGLDYDDSSWAEERPVRDALPELESCFSKIEEAAQRPIVALPPSSPEPVAFVQFQNVVQALDFRAHFEPTAEAIDLHLTLADRMVVRSFFDERGRSMLRTQALRILRRGLELGTLDIAPHRRTWKEKLRRADSLDAARVLLRSNIVSHVWLFEQYGLGRDPWAAGRETIKTFEKYVPDRDLPVFPPPAWYRHWYGRPVLYRKALDGLTPLENAREYVRDEATMREHLCSSPSFWAALKDLSVLRLARVFLAIQEHKEPLARLEDYFPDGDMPIDAITGKPFLYERTDTGIYVATPHRATKEALLKDFLAWEIES